MGRIDSRPPRLAERLIERTVSTRAAWHGVLGDLEEEYRRRLSRRPTFLCDLWYWAQALLVWCRYRWEAGWRGSARESARGGRWLDDLVRDVRRALRGMRTSPGFTAISLTVLALGIGATTAIFSVINAVIIRPLPFEEPDRLVQVFERHREAGWDRFAFSEPNAIDVRDRTTSFEEIGVIGYGLATLTGEGAPQQLVLGTVTPGFFDVLGVRPLAGRTFRNTDQDAAEPHRVLVLSEGLWTTRFGADPGVIGRTVYLDAEGYQVVGVLPHMAAPVWLDRGAYKPLVLDPESRRNGHPALSLVARLRDGIEIEGAEAELTQLARQMLEDYGPIDDDIEFVVDPASTWAAGADLKQSLWIFMGSAALLLLIGCMNLANLQMTRLGRRLRQVTLSMALGAGRGRIMRQLLTESAVLGLVGGALGIFVAWAGLHGLIALEPGTVPRMGEVGLDRTVLAFALVVSLTVGIAAGSLPAIRMFSQNIGNALRESGGKASGGRTSRTIQSWLVGTETALSLILLVGAGLLIRSLAEVQSIDSGFDPNGRITFTIVSPASSSADERNQFRTDFLEQMRSVPQILSASVVSVRPMSFDAMMGVLPKGETPETFGGNISADFRAVSDDYFETLGLTIVQGRDLDHGRSSGDGQGEAVISESLASALWPREDPVGREVELGVDHRIVTIVGVAQDMHERGLEAGKTLAIYWSYNRDPNPSMSFVLHADGEPMAVMPDVRRLLAELEPNIPITGLLTMDTVVHNSTASRRFTMTLLGLFAGLALVLALAGLYGVITQSVGQRAKELGVRIALGASAANVMGLVMRQGLRPAVIGIATGLVVTFWMSRVLESLLFGVSATDPLTYVGVGSLLGLAAAAACWVPARATLRLEAARVLREE